MNNVACVRALFAGMTLAAALAVHASPADIPGYPESVFAYDTREVAMLPQYCKYTLEFRSHVPGGNDQTEIERMYALMGPGFHAMHHYCWGLMKTNRGLLLARNQQARTFYLEASIVEFDYVLTNSPEDFVMAPEVLTKKGENLIRLGHKPQGVQSLERAIALKGDYWPPYAVLSDFYKQTGDTARARDFLEQALKFAPDAKALTRRLEELDSTKKKPLQRSHAESTQ